MAEGPEGVAAEWDPSLGTSADERPTLPCHHRAKATQRDTALEHEPWERRELCDCAELRDIPIDATASLHGGEGSGFAGNRERDATASQTRRPAHEQSCRTLHPETGLNAGIAMRRGYDAPAMTRPPRPAPSRSLATRPPTARAPTATPNPLRRSFPAVDSGCRSGRRSRSLSAGSVSSNGSTSWRRSRYMCRESACAAIWLRPTNDKS